MISPNALRKMSHGHNQEVVKHIEIKETCLYSLWSALILVVKIFFMGFDLLFFLCTYFVT